MHIFKSSNPKGLEGNMRHELLETPPTLPQSMGPLSQEFDIFKSSNPKGLGETCDMNFEQLPVAQRLVSYYTLLYSTLFYCFLYYTRYYTLFNTSTLCSMPYTILYYPPYSILCTEAILPSVLQHTMYYILHPMSYVLCSIYYVLYTPYSTLQ